MITDKPQISILLAIYEPNLDWLHQQLCSLNDQTYSNLRLYVCDDCSQEVSYEDICICVKECITEFPYSIVRNTQNLGSNATFERLTLEAAGAYFAYCDQDDIWLPEKLSVLQAALERETALLVCSDMYIVDGADRQIASSITSVRRRHAFYSGYGLAEKLFFSNFVTGCTMLVDAVQAKAAIPFCPYMVHDHYLALFCAELGKVVSLNFPLIKYRIHGGNQTGILNGVIDKVTYKSVRIDKPLQRLNWLQMNFRCGEATKIGIERAIIWLRAREAYWVGHGSGFALLKLLYPKWLITLGELVARHVPDQVFIRIVRLIQENKV